MRKSQHRKTNFVVAASLCRGAAAARPAVAPYQSLITEHWPTVSAQGLDEVWLLVETWAWVSGGVYS